MVRRRQGSHECASYGALRRVSAAALSPDRKTVELTIPDIETTWCMEIRYRLKSTDGKSVDNVIHNTIHRLGERREP